MRGKNTEPEEINILESDLNKPALLHPEKGVITRLSKAQQHNYFADRMAMFSVIIAFIYDKIQHSPITGQFTVLYDKLAAIRSSFLLNYHSHNSVERLKTGLSHIFKFEKMVISEISNFGIKPAEISDFNSKLLNSNQNKNVG